MYTASIQEHSFQVEEKNNEFVGIDNLQVQAGPQGGYICQWKGNTVVADLVSIDKDSKQIVIRIEGKKYQIQIKEPVDIFLDKLGMNLSTAKKVHQLKSPMPGLVLKLLVKEGDEVKAGDPLLVLEAMKMENVFKATGNAVVKSIKVSERQAVEKGEELIAFA